MLSKNQEIENYVDSQFGSWNYFGIRSLVKSAMDNTLKSEYPHVPYSAKEILVWAKWNDEDSFLFTPGAQAISGEQTSDTLFGAPDINPLTEKANSQAVKDGVILDTAKSATGGLVKVALAIGAIFLIFEFLKSKARKLA